MRGVYWITGAARGQTGDPEHCTHGEYYLDIPVYSCTGMGSVEATRAEEPATTDHFGILLHE